MDTAGLAFPVIPITMSCIISGYIILTVKKVKDKNTNVKHEIRMHSSSIQSKNRKATGTIIIVTAMYIISNIPLFINYVLYLITITTLEYPGPIYSSPLMYYYSWNVTAILSTGLNAAANPILYLTRFKSFRKWIKSGCLRGSTLSRQEKSIQYKVNESCRIFDASNSKLHPTRELRRQRWRRNLRESANKAEAFGSQSTSQ
jgi:hypothetical protein